ncbi:MAG: DUF3284 domain-containing protein [Atopostipes sp.]|nr:DUF3284 domain-containing protein [Atopostipes sp.]
MEIKETLSVSAEEFFDFLYHSIILDIKESTGESLKRDEIIEGMTYSKTLTTKTGQTGEATVSLTTIQPNESYKASFNTTQGENITHYEVEELTDQQIEVTYREEYVASSWLKGLNFKLMNLFFKRRSKKQASERLYQIEKYLKNQRENTN